MNVINKVVNYYLFFIYIFVRQYCDAIKIKNELFGFKSPNYIILAKDKIVWLL